MRLIDLSTTITNSPESTPSFIRTDISYNDHAFGAVQIQSILKVPANLLRNGEGWSSREIGP